jgi:hypothetical protein
LWTNAISRTDQFFLDLAKLGDWTSRTERTKLFTIDFEPKDPSARSSREKHSALCSEDQTLPFNAVLIILAVRWCARFWGICLQKRNSNSALGGTAGKSDIG